MDWIFQKVPTEWGFMKKKFDAILFFTNFAVVWERLCLELIIDN